MKKFLFLILFGMATLFLASGQNVIKTCKVISSCTIRKTPGPNEAIAKIKEGTKVDVLDFENNYYKINYNGNIGYINEMFIYDEDLKQLVEEREKQEQIEAEKRHKEFQQKRKKRLIERYGEYRARLIMANKVCIGMSKNEAIESWGSPDDKNITRYSFGVHEQWVYEGKNYDNKYLYFEDDVLTTIQE